MKNCNKKKKPISEFVSLFILIATFVMGIGYASINNISLDIDGKVTAVVQDGIFISDVTYNENESKNIDTSLNSFVVSSTMLHTNIVLAKQDLTSKITYDLTIFNNSNFGVSFDGIVSELNVPDKNVNNYQYITYNISYENENNEFVNLSKGTTLLSQDEIHIKITFSYIQTIDFETAESNYNELNSYITFNFTSSSAYAIYSATDNSLRFYNRDYITIDNENGITYFGTNENGEQLEVTNIYENFEYDNANWMDIKNSVTKVIFEDEIYPSNAVEWFDGFTNTTFFDLTKLNTTYSKDITDMLNGCSSIETLKLGETFGNSEQTFTAIGLDKVITGWTKESEDNVTDYSSKTISLGVSETYTSVTYSYATAWFDDGYSNPYMNIYQRKYVPTEGETFDGYTVGGVYSWRNDTVSDGCRPPKNYDTGEHLQSWNEPKPLNSAYGKLTDSIEKVKVVDNIKPQSLANWFEQFIFVKSYDLEKIDTSEVTSMYRMFYINSYAESKITELDLSKFNTANVTNMGGMFQNNSKLITIKVSNNFVVDNVTTSSNMFYDCTKLVGGNGTVFNSEIINKTYARIDTLEYPGYFTLASAQ